MTLQEYQLEARKTAHHTAHLGMEYLVLKLCGEAGELATEMVQDVPSFDRQIREMGDVIWYVSEIYSRHGWALTCHHELDAPNLGSYGATWLQVLVAASRLAESVGKAIGKALPCDPALVRRECEVILHYLGLAAHVRGSSLEEVADVNIAKLAARQAAGTVLGGLRASEPGLTSNGNGWISMVSCPPIQSGDSSDDVEVVDEHIDGDGNLSMTIVLQDGQSDGYIVRLEPGVWLCPEEEDDMGRTLQRKWAAVYPSEGEAQSALAAARRHRAFQEAVIERVGDS